MGSLLLKLERYQGKLKLKTKTGNHNAGKDKHQPGSQIRSDSQ